MTDTFRDGHLPKNKAVKDYFVSIFFLMRRNIRWKITKYVSFTVLSCILTLSSLLLLQPMHNKFALKHQNLH